MVKGFQGYTVTFGFQAGIKLLVTVRLRIARIKIAYPMEVFPTLLSKCFCKSKSDITPIGIIGGNVSAGGFDKRYDIFDIGLGQIASSQARRNDRFAVFVMGGREGESG
jgi:hypothetical protein